MDRRIEQAYKRNCFQGRGAVARWVDRGFFSALCGVGSYGLWGEKVTSLLLASASVLLFTLWDMLRWQKFRQKLWRREADQLKRESWLRQEAEAIRRQGGVILFPTPDRDTLQGLCLGRGQGASFHCFGAARDDLVAQAQALGCTVWFHPWGNGAEPSREQVQERLVRDAPKRKAKPWRHLLTLPGGRYYMAGLLLLILSVFLKRALYWRLMGSVCLLIGAFRRAFHTMANT